MVQYVEIVRPPSGKRIRITYSAVRPRSVFPSHGPRPIVSGCSSSGIDCPSRERTLRGSSDERLIAAREPRREDASPYAHLERIAPSPVGRAVDDHALERRSARRSWPTRLPRISYRIDREADVVASRRPAAVSSVCDRQHSLGAGPSSRARSPSVRSSPSLVAVGKMDGEQLVPRGSSTAARTFFRRRLNRRSDFADRPPGACLEILRQHLDHRRLNAASLGLLRVQRDRGRRVGMRTTRP